MRLEHHVVISVGVSTTIWLVTKSWPMTAASLAMGIFMDGDHVVDYVREFGVRLNMKKLFEASYQRTFKRSWLVLHAWEWLPFVIAAAWGSRWNPWVVGLALGWFQHLLADQLINTPNPWAYSILWRWRHDFDHQRAFPFHKKEANQNDSPL